MTPDERNLLTLFLEDLATARAGSKDAEAETLINRALASNPDAAYMLVQHAILSDQALHAAQAQLRAMQDGAAFSGSSFFGGGQTAVPPTAGQGQPYARQAQPYPQQAYPAQSYASSGGGMFGGGLGSFLRAAGATAAGVAGGEFLFSGLSGLFGGHGMGGGFGGGLGGFGGGGVENVTINQYGDSGSGDSGSGGYDDSSGGDDGSGGGGDDSGGF